MIAQTEWARVVARTLEDAGVRVVVASPGSRSTPYLAAFLRSGLRVLDVLDERSAGFVALGLARATGEPAAVLCTSGTAPGHWMPAVLEASKACVPLVLLSADRPTELSLCGAPQTVDQLGLFGSHVRFFADAGNPEDGEGPLAALRRLVGQAVAQACGPLAGPVHLNLRARKPLEPREPVSDAEHAARRVADAVLARPVARSRSRVVPAERDLDDVASLLSASEHTLIVAGPLPVGADASAIHGLARRPGAALAAELTSQVRFATGARRFDSIDGWLSAGLWSEPHQERAVPSPDLVVELGGPPTSGAYERWVARARPRRVVIGASSHTDPHASAEHVLRGDVSELARALLMRVVERAGGTGFGERLDELDREAEALATLQASDFGEAVVARIVASRVPPAGRLVVGNSLPIRMLDRYAGRTVRTSGLDVVHQRGANGIDGLVSQTYGASLLDARPVVALLGDLTLLHDVGALATVRRASWPLVLVVVDNAGGRIFEGLPVARDAAWMMPHMVTEEPLDHAALSAAFGIAHTRVETRAALEAALEAALARAGASMIVARVDPHGAARDNAAFVGALSTALEMRRRSA